MRDEQYYVLANLIKRPMHRWWARVGCLWLVTLPLLLVGYFIQVIPDIKPQLFMTDCGLDGPKHWQMMMGSPVIFFEKVLVGIALLCSVQVINLVNGIVKDTLPFSESVKRIISYKLALLNCWPILFVLWLVGVINSIAYDVLVGNRYVYTETAIDSIVNSGFYSIWIVWLIAVAVVSNPIRWPAWALLTGGVLASLGYATFYFTGWSSQEWSSGFYSITFPWSVLIEGLGLFLIYQMYFFYVVRKVPTANKMCFAFSLLLLLAGIRLGVGIVPVDIIIQAGGILTDGLRPVWIDYYSNAQEWIQKDPELLIYIGGFHKRFSVNPAFGFVPTINAIFWPVVHYFAFSWLMRRKVPASKYVVSK